MNQLSTAGFEATNIRRKFGRNLAELCDVERD